MELGKESWETISRSMEKKLQDVGIDVRDGELSVELHFDADTFSLKIIINGPKRVLNEIEMFWHGRFMDTDLEFDPDELDSIVSDGLLLPFD